ncbi:hypothetical protein BJ322DRAFT_1108733 [Thelephora terrestris]|uniref:DUF6535 domain-containing protein n=1 Tax=Thelephora terrestris TaxID=56493 RepID=A0A9P6HE55_9AGAM|nr:hypothetical protein BJ322DRAFT_1108733 [Thelephora terrestris]
MAEGTSNQANATIDPKSLEDAVHNALRSYFPSLEASSDARAEFFNKFKREADEHDNDFLKKHGGDLDITLIFAGLFSAVASAFIIAIQTQLQPDYTQLNYDVLRIIAESKGLNLPANPSSDSPWTGPNPTLIHVQAILFSSLAVSLLAAFVAMLGKQWLNRYSQADMRGSPTVRSRDRQRKMEGMATWRFRFVMESLPMMLQAALLLLGCALSKYLFTIDDLVAWVVVGFTASGLLFYLLIVIAATISCDSPFQTPLSLIIRFMVYLSRSASAKFNMWLHRTFSRKGGQRRRKPHRSTGSGRPDGNNGNGHTELTVDLPHLPPVLLTDRDGYVLDSKCIAWMFEMSMDPDVILDIMKFIPEIIWHNGIQITPLEKLYDTVLQCLDHSSGSPVVIPKFRNKAYHSARALVHLAVQRKCYGSDKEVFDIISLRHRVIGSRHYKGDSDLEYTLGMIDRVFGHDDHDHRPMRWDKFSFTNPHHAWMSHILLYRACDTFEKDRTLPDDIEKFVDHSLQLVPLPDPPIILDCLLIIGFALDIQLDSDELHVDNRPKHHSQIKKIHTKLVETFENVISTSLQVDRAFRTMKHIAPLSEIHMAAESYNLFCAIMRAPLSPAHLNEKWKASRLALHWAYKWDEGLPQVEAPEEILDFISHHFELAKGGEDQDEPIQNAFRALAYGSTQKTIEILKDGSREPSFARGICFTFQCTRPRELRRAALFFLPLIAESWFNDSGSILDPEEKKNLCLDLASTVDEVWGTDNIQKAAHAVLLGMVKSPQWRPHIDPDNAAIIEEFSSMGSPDGATLRSAISWLKRKEPEEEVQRQLEAVTLNEGPSREGHRRIPPSDGVGVGEG